MTGAEARDLLRSRSSFDMIEGWQFRIEAIPGGLRILTGEPGAAPATWKMTQ